jgi:hypothetical protein
MYPVLTRRHRSINSGFKALRTTLPSSLAGDSKAIVLRKAVQHINQLEDLLRQAGIAYTGTPLSASGGPPPPALTRGDSGSTHEGEADEENEEDDDDDVQMREATGGVAVLQVDQKQEAEWEHVETVNGRA